MNDATDNGGLPAERGVTIPENARGLRGYVADIADYLGRTLRPGPLCRKTGIDESDQAAYETGFELPLADGRILPPGHYRVTVPIFGGVEALRAPILEVISVYSARNRSVRLERTATSSGYVLGCEMALISVVTSLRFVPGSVDSEIRCGPVRLRRLTRPEYYGRLITRVLSRQKREGASLRAVVGNMLDVLRTRGPRGLAADLRRTDNLSPEAAYELWMEIRERLDHVREVHKQRLRRGADGLPVISVIVVAENGDPRGLSETLASVREQVYERWELIVVVASGTLPSVVAVVKAAALDDKRIRVLLVGDEGDLALARNAALTAATGEWVAALQAGDTLSPVALAVVACDAPLHPSVRLYYADDDVLGAKSQRCRPRFKPDFSRELLRSTDYMGDLMFLATASLREHGGWRSGFGEAVDYDLALRAFEGGGASSIRHLGQILHHRRPKPSGASKRPAMRRALEEHLARTSVPARVEEIAGLDAIRVRHALPSPPMVSIVVPTRDKVELLRRCIESILALTDYRNYEILVVDNGSTDAAALAYLADLRGHDRVRVLGYNEPFNFSRINNFAVREASGSVLGLLNNDTVVISPDWLTEMVSWAALPDVGCVGAKLYYADDTVQHAGVVIGVGDVAGHAHRRFPRDHEGYCQRLKVVQNLSAVTAACLVVRKDVYEKVGGLNERDLTIAYNDVDFCLRIRAAGYLNVWTPFAELYHLESLSRGSDRSGEKARRYADEVAYMHEHWDLKTDPYYSPHLTRLREDFSIAV